MSTKTTTPVNPATHTRDGVPLVGIDDARSWYDALSEDHQTVVDHCIDGEVMAAGYTSTRPGSKVHDLAFRHAVTNLRARAVDLDELAQSHAEAESDFATLS